MNRDQGLPDSPKLLDCPFCGQPPAVVWRAFNPRGGCKTPGCKGSQLPTLSLDLADDVAAWNTRALSVEARPSPLVVKALRSTVEMLACVCGDDPQFEAYGVYQEVCAALAAARQRAGGGCIDPAVGKARFGVFHEDGRFEELTPDDPVGMKHPRGHTARWVGGVSDMQLLRAALSAALSPAEQTKCASVGASVVPPDLVEHLRDGPYVRDGKSTRSLMADAAALLERSILADLAHRDELQVMRRQRDALRAMLQDALHFLRMMSADDVSDEPAPSGQTLTWLRNDLQAALVAIERQQAKEIARG